MDLVFEDENHMKLIKVAQINGADSTHTSLRRLLDLCFFIHAIFSTFPHLQYFTKHSPLNVTIQNIQKMFLFAKHTFLVLKESFTQKRTIAENVFSLRMRVK